MHPMQYSDPPANCTPTTASFKCCARFPPPRFLAIIRLVQVPRSLPFFCAEPHVLSGRRVARLRRANAVFLPCVAVIYLPGRISSSCGLQARLVAMARLAFIVTLLGFVAGSVAQYDYQWRVGRASFYGADA